MEHKTHKVTAVVERYPGDKGWYFVPVPVRVSKLYAAAFDRGVLPVRATIGKTTWETSLLPKGDGTHFISFPAKVRTAQDIDVGSTVTVQFVRRDPLSTTPK